MNVELVEPVVARRWFFVTTLKGMPVVTLGWTLVLSSLAVFAVEIGENHLKSQAQCDPTVCRWITPSRQPPDWPLRCREAVAATEALDDRDQGRDYALLCVAFGTSLIIFVITLVCCLRLQVAGFVAPLRLMLPSGEPAAAEEFWSWLTPSGYLAVWCHDENDWYRQLLLALARLDDTPFLPLMVEGFLADGEVAGVSSLAQAPCP